MLTSLDDRGIGAKDIRMRAGGSLPALARV